MGGVPLFKDRQSRVLAAISVAILVCMPLKQAAATPLQDTQQGYYVRAGSEADREHMLREEEKRQDPAWALGVYGIADFSQAHIASPTATNPDTERGFGPGPGVLLRYKPIWQISLELNGAVLQRVVSQYQEGLDKTMTTRWVAVTPIIRVWPNHVLSMGVGGYYAWAAGDVDQEWTTIEGQRYSGTFSHSAAGIRDHDAGLVGAAGFNLPINTNVRLILDGRYTLGLTDISTDSADVTYHDLQGLVGLAFKL